MLDTELNIQMWIQNWIYMMYKWIYICKFGLQNITNISYFKLDTELNIYIYI